MNPEEPERPKKIDVSVGDNLESLSVDELEVRIMALQEEIGRCQDEISAKQSSRASAESVFKS